MFFGGYNEQKRRRKMQQTKRLELLNNSLTKKEKVFNDLFIAHIVVSS